MENTNQTKSNINLVLIGVVAILTIILFFKGCGTSAPVVTKTIKTKEVKGKFEAVKPNQIVIHDTIKIGQKLSKNNDEFLQRQINELILENKNLQNLFNEASDSLKISMYNKAIELKSFNQTFEDDKLKAVSSGLVRGEIQSLKLDYTIKPQTIELPTEKENVFRLLIGGGFGINKVLSQPTYKANAGFQTRNGNVYIGSFQRIGANDYFLGEVNFSIFSIKGKKK